MPRETDFPHGHVPRSDMGERITEHLQRFSGVTELDLRNKVELILAVILLREVLK